MMPFFGCGVLKNEDLKTLDMFGQILWLSSH